MASPRMEAGESWGYIFDKYSKYKINTYQKHLEIAKIKKKIRNASSYLKLQGGSSRSASSVHARGLWLADEAITSQVFTRCRH